MGINASKRVERALQSSPEFDAACSAVFDHCQIQAQHAFPGVRRYQIPDAAARLHAALSDSVAIVKHWVPSPPDRAHVDATLRRVHPGGDDDLTPAEFRAFAAELFRDAIVSAAGMAVLWRGIAGVAGIAGIGMAARAGRVVVGRVMGVYAAGVVAAAYLSLS